VPEAGPDHMLELLQSRAPIEEAKAINFNVKVRELAVALIEYIGNTTGHTVQGRGKVALGLMGPGEGQARPLLIM
jgi:hypothetical protein